MGSQCSEDRRKVKIMAREICLCLTISFLVFGLARGQGGSGYNPEDGGRPGGNSNHGGSGYNPGNGGNYGNGRPDNNGNHGGSGYNPGGGGHYNGGRPDNNGGYNPGRPDNNNGNHGGSGYNPGGGGGICVAKRR